MPPTASFARAARPLFQQATFAAQARHAFRRSARQQQSRRWQSSSTAAGEAQVSWFKRMWDSPIGLKTVHFWAPVMKWALVIAGMADMARPADKLSLTQNLALTATGLIWTRWCLIIKPKNYLLAAVNFFLGLVGITQVTRIMLWQQSQKNKASAPAVVEDVKAQIKDVVKS